MSSLPKNATVLTPEAIKARLVEIMRQIRVLQAEGRALRRALAGPPAPLPKMDACRHCRHKWKRRPSGRAVAVCPNCKARDWQALPPAYEAQVVHPAIFMTDPLVLSSQRTGLPLPPGFIAITRYSIDGGKTWLVDDIELYEPSEPIETDDYYALAREDAA